jgi:glycosyltransferase involved in cell wall biosynthesis
MLLELLASLILLSLIRAIVDRVHAASFAPKEIIIVDDCSRDGFRALRTIYEHTLLRRVETTATPAGFTSP